MVLNEYILEEIMKLPSDGSTSLMKSLQILKGYDIVLLSEEKTFDIVYKVKVEDILNNPIDNEQLIKLRNGNWKLDDKKEYLIRNLNEK